MRSKIATLLAIAILTVVAVVSARYALADYYYERAKQVYNSLDQAELVYSHQLAPALSEVNKSLAVRGASAHSLDFKADLLYQSWLLSPDAQYFDQSKLLQRAADAHLQALALRKNWAFSTARLALIYSQQATLDDRFAQWFAESHRLGLYETIVARSSMTLGLQRWPQLTDAQQRLTLDFIRTSIEQKVNSPQAMVILLKRYKKLREVCLRLPSTQRKDKVCEDLAESA